MFEPEFSISFKVKNAFPAPIFATVKCLKHFFSLTIKMATQEILESELV